MALEQILAERADKIKQAKEAQKQARIKAKKQQDEIMESQMGLHNIFWYRCFYIALSSWFKSICRW